MNNFSTSFKMLTAKFIKTGEPVVDQIVSDFKAVVAEHKAQISAAKAEATEKINALRGDGDVSESRKVEIQADVEAVLAARNATITEHKSQIKAAKTEATEKIAAFYAEKNAQLFAKTSVEYNPGDPILKVDDLCQYFAMGKRELRAVDHVSFDIKKGEIFGLVGESGCGKTTTGRSIIKLYNITSGNVYFKGQRIGAGIRSYKDAIKAAKADASKKIKALNSEAEAADETRKAEITAEIAQILADRNAVISENRDNIRAAKLNDKMVNHKYVQDSLEELKAEFESKIEAAEANGSTEEVEALQKEYKIKTRVAKKSRLSTQIQMIFQDPIASLDPRMTVRDIIAEGLVIKGITDKDYINQKVYDILETVGLVREHADRYPHEFSGGQRQRIGIARAVVMEPEMIIADEPVSALDVSIQAQVINLLNDLRERLGLTILFIAHDLSVVKYFSDRIGVMYFGKMVELADSDELFKNPLHPYTRSLLSAIPLPDPMYEKQRTRVTYNPIVEHNYTESQPTFREVSPGHFVYCNDEEEAKYKELLK